MRKDLVLRVPLEGQCHAVGLIAAGAQLGHQTAHMNLCAAVHERNLNLAHDDRANHDVPTLVLRALLDHTPAGVYPALRWQTGN